MEINPGSGPAVLVLRGRLDATTSGELDAQLKALCAEGYATFILVCEELNYLSSAGLKVLIAVRKTLVGQTPAGGIMLASVRAHVIDVLQISGLESFFPIYPSLEAAHAAHGSAR